MNDTIKTITKDTNNSNNFIDKEQMKNLLRCMFNGWILHEKSWIPASVSDPFISGGYTRDKTSCMIEACNGDVITGQLLYLFDYWGNDIQSLAPHFGIFLERDADNNLLVREDIPPAPSVNHHWAENAWHLDVGIDEDTNADDKIIHGLW